MKFFVTIFADEEGEFWQQQGEGGHLAGHIGENHHLAGHSGEHSPPSRTHWRKVTT